MNLKSPSKTCTLCSLAEGDDNPTPLPGEGKVNSQYALVDFSPTSAEDLQGKHYPEDSGALLEAMLNSVGLSRRDFYMTKIVKCKLDYGKSASVESIKTCTTEFLKHELEAIQPKSILALGSDAGKYFVSTRFRITTDRGWYKWEGYNVYLTYHPRYLLRFPSLESGSPKWNAWNDLKEFSQQNYLAF